MDRQVTDDARRPLERFLIVTVCALLILTWMRYAREIVVPFLLATFLAVMLSSPLKWLKSKKVPFTIAIFLVLSLVVFMIVIVSFLLGSSVDQFSQNLPLYQSQLQKLIIHTAKWLEQYDINISKTGLLKAVNPSSILPLINSLLGSLGAIFSKGFLIIFTVILMLIELWDLPIKIKAFYGTKSDRVLYKFNLIDQSIRSYLAVKSILSLITGVLITLCLKVIGLEFAVLLGTLAFLLNYIPNIGSIIAAIPAIILSLIQLGLLKTLIVIAIYLIINVIIGNFIEPRFIGKRVGLSTLIVFLSLIFWGWILGPVGMILAVPLTMTIKSILMVSEDKDKLQQNEADALIEPQV